MKIMPALSAHSMVHSVSERCYAWRQAVNIIVKGCWWRF